MKILISYFYQIRFFTPNMIPVSTAHWDPKFFHNFKSSQYIFRDKNNVWNGIRCSMLEPQEGGCPCEIKNPPECYFLKNYLKQLRTVDFNELLIFFQTVIDRAQQLYPFEGDPTIVLIVYETPDNPCSERVILKQWFQEHGYNLQEFKKSLD